MATSHDLTVGPDDTGLIRIERYCAGRCGEIITYALDVTGITPCDAPDATPPARIAYGSGHLCIECGRAVERALIERRRARGL